VRPPHFFKPDLFRLTDIDVDGLTLRLLFIESLNYIFDVDMLRHGILLYRFFIIFGHLICVLFL